MRRLWIPGLVLCVFFAVGYASTRALVAQRAERPELAKARVEAAQLKASFGKAPVRALRARVLAPAANGRELRSAVGKNPDS